MPRHFAKRALSIVASTLLLASCDSDDNNTPAPQASPPGTDLSLRALQARQYDGVNDGLIAGLGRSNLLSATPPGYADPQNPSAEELRKNTFYNNYRALIDSSPNGAYGTLYGPKDDTTYAGREFIALVGDGHSRATVAAQIPDSFDTDAPCIIAGPASGSRGVYGAVATTIAWAMEKGCATALTDGNKGTGAVDLSNQRGFDLQMQLKSLTGDISDVPFVVPTEDNASGQVNSDYLPTQAELDAFVAQHPNRLAYNHAHNQINSEKDWGKHTLEAIEFTFKMLNERMNLGKTFTADNTLVIAASISNGGSAVLRAAEADTQGLIDAVVAGEPNITPEPHPEAARIEMGQRAPVTEHGKASYEYFVLGELYSACAAKDPALSGAAFAELLGPADTRCQALVDAGLLEAGSVEELGAQATQKLVEGGFLAESGKILVGYASFEIFQSLVATYGNAYTRSSVVDKLCQVSMAAVDNAFAPAPLATLATLPSTSNGIPSNSGVYLIKEDALNGPRRQAVATSSNGNQDYNMEGALCWRALWADDQNPLHERLMQGVREIRGNGHLQGKPTLIVHGRDDALIPVNHSSRSYYILNQQREGDSSQLRYYEVTQSQHLDAFNPLYQAADMRYVPIDYYFKEAMDLMWAHLKEQAPLPPSQVVFTTPPEAGTELQAEHVPAIQATPGSAAIVYRDGVLSVPDQPPSP